MYGAFPAPPSFYLGFMLTNQTVYTELGRSPLDWMVTVFPSREAFPFALGCSLAAIKERGTAPAHA